MSVRLTAAAACTVLASLASPAAAHKPSDAHVHIAIDGGRVHGRIAIAVRDLDAALPIDDGDGTITWGEIVAGEPRVIAYLRDRFALYSGGELCSLAFTFDGLVDLSDGPYWVAAVTASCPAALGDLELAYGLLFDIDAQHRGLLHVDGQQRTVIVRDRDPVRLQVHERGVLGEFVVEGVWHIWHGIDHMLFLTALILPSVWRSSGRGWSRRRRADGHPRARDSLREVCVEVLEIVTAFTLAHSITLVISAAGLVRFPSRFVETAIALSVVAAAVNNLVRAVDARWAVAFALGLLHGFGFSSVLIDLGLPSHELIGALLGFNVGVELGQAAFVIVLLPTLFAIRRTIAYQVLLYGGSVAIAIVAAVWSFQRCFS